MYNILYVSNDDHDITISTPIDRRQYIIYYIIIIIIAVYTQPYSSFPQGPRYIII